MTRSPDHPVDTAFVTRWSPRSFAGETLPETGLLPLFEAARWAPSAFNEQPWRFVFALRDTPDFPRFLELLDPFNASWAQHAGALVFLASVPLRANGDGLPSHSFDAGAAWAQLALQAASSGLAAHALGGIHRDRVPEALGLPATWKVEVGIAIGRPAPADRLPEGLRQREVPSGRRPIDAFVWNGRVTG